jgi:hypothetical protein
LDRHGHLYLYTDKYSDTHFHMDLDSDRHADLYRNRHFHLDSDQYPHGHKYGDGDRNAYFCGCKYNH